VESYSSSIPFAFSFLIPSPPFFFFSFLVPSLLVDSSIGDLYCICPSDRGGGGGGDGGDGVGAVLVLVVQVMGCSFEDVNEIVNNYEESTTYHEKSKPDQK